MKRTIISLLVFVGMFIVGAVPNAQADDRGCSNASLQGAYGVYSSATIVPAGIPRVSVGRWSFDGKGSWSITLTVNLNGTVTHLTDSGPYTVNADCTGMLFPGTGGSFAIVLVDGGREFDLIRADPPTQVLFGVDKKQFPDGDEASCSNATLKGTYGGYTTGTVVPAGTPRVVLRRETFDGKGNWSNTLTVNDNGTVTQGSFSGTYTVNADCTVTFGANAVGVLVDGGKELYFISTGAISQRVTYTVDKKQFPEDDDEQ